MKKVIATAAGFHDGTLRPKGTVFQVADTLAGKWFKPFVADASPPAREAKPGKEAPTSRDVI